MSLVHNFVVKKSFSDHTKIDKPSAINRFKRALNVCRGLHSMNTEHTCHESAGRMQFQGRMSPVSLRKQPTFRHLVSPRNDVWGTFSEILYWWRVTMQFWVVLLIGCASDWFKQIFHVVQQIRSTTNNCVVTRHQYGIFAVVPQTPFRRKTSSGVAKCRLFTGVRIL